jgi:serine/threonine protein kinase/tetratricopeptide (TPR) repeat protein
MKCPHCQTENSEKAKFCRGCGKTFQTEIVCVKCQYPNIAGSKFCEQCGQSLALEESPTSTKTPTKPISQPVSFAGGRYQVKKFLGEGGKKKVYLAHDATLDRDVAFALIKTEKLDETGKTRIKREVKAMGRLGDHPNIVTVYDFGDHEGQPYIVLPLLPGGDVEGLIKKAPDHKLTLDKALEIARAVCKGLEFAHAKSIVHRDIKPGNVWLSADGTAKIGDFGLAVAVELSRLTKSGMMVGTVSYMPPEQAMGGKVTTKADLYSLGAMLYEMVTGRPPFVGDDSVSIIGQHINTPPVSPAWHRADLPPALDTLIMQLLEKDPAKRPESATVVLQALEAIEAGKSKIEPSKEATSSENPLYRRVFVGREPELKQLQNAFDSAMSGKGALMMVMGEPGIGKTALCEQLSTYVTLRGGRTLVGHCYEEGSLSLPYLAFVEALRSYVLSREIKDLRDELGTGAADVARIVSEIRDRLKVKPRPQKDPEEERYRLMQAVTSFLTNAASVQPQLVVLEDLHDADKGTLDMLTHVSRNLSGARLIIVGTYRDVEVDRTHPLSAALADLRRVANYGRVILRGLNADEVRRMLESITRESVPWGLAEAVHRQTEGNPLFVQEVVRYLAEEGLITQKEGRWRPAKDTPLEMNIPEGLRDVIGKRLSLLSKECNQLLSIASVIGREFTLETLKAVAKIDEEAFVNALKQAVQLSVLEERSQLGVVRYRFTHAFFRQTLYEEMIAPQRLKLHQQVARALEAQYAKRLEEHAAELAEHFSHSTDPTDLKKAVEYGELAAKRATDVYAYGEAVRLLDQAIKVQKVLDPDDKAKLCDLFLALCDALLDVPDTRRVIETEAPAALSLAESISDDSRAARVCMSASWAFVYEQGMGGAFNPERIRWTERLDSYARPDTAERAWADAWLGNWKYVRGDNAAGKKHLTQAIELARRIDEQAALEQASTGFLQYSSAPQYAGDRLKMAEEFLVSPYFRGLRFGQGFQVTGSVFLTAGQRARAEKVFGELRTKAEHTGHFRTQLLAAAMDATLALYDGHFEDAMAIVQKTEARGEHEGVIGITKVLTNHPYYRTCIYLGENLEKIVSELGRGSPMACALLGWIQAYLGRKAEVAEILEKYVVQRPGFGTDEDETRFWVETLFLESAVLVGHRQAAELLLKRLNVPGLYTTGVSFPTCITRHLGGAAALLARYDEARKYYMEAIRICTEMLFRPELALTRLQLAELLLEHYSAEKREALEHLDFAIKEFREMKMQPSLERALRHKEILKA